MSDVIRIGAATPQTEDRFARFRLIGWWDQERLAGARVVVIGAGALGNEIVKDLALLGLKNVFVADRDRIENSNLSRSILFRERDCGRSKALVAAERATEIYPDIRVQAFDGNIVYDLGQGIYRWADVILGGLDNREARVAINLATARAGKVWIDGAIERLDGVARVFDPATGPCYECTMGENDWKMLEARRSCASSPATRWSWARFRPLPQPRRSSPASRFRRRSNISTASRPSPARASSLMAPITRVIWSPIRGRRTVLLTMPICPWNRCLGKSARPAQATFCERV